MNDQPNISQKLWKSLQKDIQDYLKEQLWPGFWMLVWFFLWFQFYESVNPYNSSDQLILAVVSLLVLMNFLRECKVRIDNIFFLSATWLMLIFGALLPNQSYDWIPTLLGFSAILFLFRIFATRKELMDDILKDGQNDDVKIDSNGDDQNDMSNESKR
ncbi:hypothetical protein K8I31_12880 [bacterium]|nr:hypothetical protein [bacterium]